MTDDFQT